MSTYEDPIAMPDGFPQHGSRESHRALNSPDRVRNREGRPVRLCDEGQRSSLVVIAAPHL
jgi:hypothetical protein